MTRAGDPRDGRAIALTVTPAGRRLHQRIERDLIEEERQLLQDFEPEVRAAAIRLISRLARAAEGRAGLGAGACCPPSGE